MKKSTEEEQYNEPSEDFLKESNQLRKTEKTAVVSEVNRE